MSEPESERFKEAARKLGVDANAKRFEGALDKILKIKHLRKPGSPLEK